MYGFVAILILGVAWLGLLSLDLRDRRGSSRSRAPFTSGRGRAIGGLPPKPLGLGGRGGLASTGVGAGGLRVVPRPRKGLGFVPSTAAEARERRQLVLVALLGLAVVTLAGTFLVSRTVFVLHAFVDGALASYGWLLYQRSRGRTATTTTLGRPRSVSRIDDDDFDVAAHA